jgi:Uma2 family endonuclease
MTLPATKSQFTPQEYLRLETATDAKHEFHAGEILAMSGGTYRHSRISANLTGEIRLRLKGSPCFVLESNMRVRLKEYDRGAKFSSYRSLDSLEEYLLVSQNEPMAETFTRQPDGTWLFSAYRGLGASVKLQSVRIEIPLSEVYAGLENSSEGIR